TSGTVGSVTVSADGSFTWQPPYGFAGMTTFSYTITDGSSVSGPATVTLWAIPLAITGEIGDPPPLSGGGFSIFSSFEAVDDAYPVGEAPISHAGDGVLANDSGAYIAILLGHPAAGRLTDFTQGGEFAYTPGIYIADQSFGYRIFSADGEQT